jgi:hypothetical protein
MTAVQLSNLGLLKIGVSKGIVTVNDSTREAYTIGQFYDTALRATLRAFSWPFATKYAALDLTQGPAWTSAPVQAWTAAQVYAIGAVVQEASVVYYCVLGHTAVAVTNQPPNATYWSTTPTTEANGDWLYAYRQPSDCIFARRLVIPGGRRAYDKDPYPFRIGRDSNGLLVFAQVQDAVLEYTTIDCTNLWVDDLFIDAFTWKLGALAAPSLAKDSKLTLLCEQMFSQTLNTASTVAAKEGQQQPAGDADWLGGR